MADKIHKLKDSECASKLMPVKDALEVLSGKWKLQIIISLTFGNKRFKDISRDVGGISDKMLSKELKELELNQLVNRKLYDSFPPVAQYELTEHGKTLQPVIDNLGNWGALHRKKLFGK